MFFSKYVRFILLATFIVAGAWFMSRAASPSAETVTRHDAQMAFAPLRDGDNSSLVDVDRNATDGIVAEAVKPVVVDMADMPSRASDVDQLYDKYLKGEIDLDTNEGPVSDAVFQNLLAESAKQPVDKTVQPYSISALEGTLNAGASFKSIDYTQSQQGVPPDPDITVGTNHVVVGVNTSFQVFDKSGNSLVGPTLFEDFWGSNCGTGASTMTFFDPFLDYDEKENRYVLGITAYDTAVNGGDNGYACIAVSQTDNAAGQWNLYSFDGNPGGGADYFFDYPHLGVGQNALYLSANMFGSSFVRNHVFAYDKFAMYNGQSANSVKFNVGATNFTLQPAKMHGYNFNGWPTNANEPHYFVDAQYGNNQNTLTVWQMSDPFGSGSSLTQAGTVSVNSYSLPVSQPQLGGSNLQGNDNRLLDVKYWGGKLYATHAVGCNPGGGTVNCIRWYEIDISSGSPSLVQQGTFASSGEYRSFPAIAPNACGDILIGYTKTSSSMYPSVYVAGREAGDPLGQLKDETLLKAGEDYYTAYDSVPRRWGDYTGMGIDPNGLTFWYLGEYSRPQATARWSTWVGSYTWSGCTTGGPTPTPAPTATATNTPAPTNTPGPQTCTVYPSSDVPKAISSSGTPSINSVVSVPSGGTIQDVNLLDLNGTHTYISDLDFNLSSPAGTSVQLIAPACGSQDNFDLSLDDDAGSAIPCPPTGGGTHVPSNPLAAFNGENSAGTWTLTINDSANLDGGSLDGWSLEVCVAGTGPNPTNTPVPPTATNTPVPPTATSPAPTATSPAPTATPGSGGDELVYVSSTSGGTVSGISFADEDILEYNVNTDSWSMYFDGSDVGVTNDVNAFVLLSDGRILLSFNTGTSVPGVGTVDDSDIVEFTPTALGSSTAGTFAFFFDGSDVGLTTNNEDIDALAVSADGTQLIISTIGSHSASGASGTDEDLLIFTATSLGTTTAGTFATYFDGSDVALNTSSSEDVYGATVASNGDIYLNTNGSYSVAGLSGDGDDIFVCTPSSTGTTTACTFSLYWDGDAHGFGSENVDSSFVVR